MNPKLSKRSLNELDGSNVGGPGESVDDLFMKARNHFQAASDDLNKLLKLLQSDYKGVQSSPVAASIKVAADAVDEMDALSQSWQEEAQKAKEAAAKEQASAPVPGMLNGPPPQFGAITPESRRHRRPSLDECLALINNRGNDASFDARPYVRDRLVFEKPKSLRQLTKESVFNFDKFFGEDIE